jgi:hypothetical protein
MPVGAAICAAPPDLGPSRIAFNQTCSNPAWAEIGPPAQSCATPFVG